MNPRSLSLPTDDMDGLRLLALGRIPRCEGCPRYEGLVSAYLLSRERSGPLPTSLPGVPEFCRQAYCAPLAARYVRRPAAARSPVVLLRPLHSLGATRTMAKSSGL